jgi:tape measure domain-containing protein
MADKNEALILQMSADTRRMEKSLNALRGQTNRQLTAIERRFDQMGQSVKRSGDTMSRDMRTALAGIGVSVAVSEVTKYADAWTTASNRLAAAGVETEKLASTQQRLVSLALQTRTEFSATVELYARLSRSTQQLGADEADLLRATEILNKAFKAGGASASEQASAIMQLGQALGSGVLQGDELRSLRENAPLLAQAIADEFDTTIAGLKKLGAEGKLTTDRIFAGILNAGDAIDSQFGRTVATIGDAFTNLQTKAIEYFGTVDKNLGVTEKFAGLIGAVADNLHLLGAAATATIAVLGAQGIGGAMSAAAKRFAEARTAFAEHRDLLRQQAIEYRKLGQAHALAAVQARQTVGINEALRAISWEQIVGSKELTAAYRTHEAATREVALAKTALTKANLAVGASEGAEALRRSREVTFASHRLAEAEARLSILRRAAPAEIAAYYSANAALAQSQQAAAVATDRLAATQVAQSQAAAKAAGSGAVMSGLFRGLTTLLTGPIGTIALIAALTFGLQGLSFGVDETAERADRLHKNLKNLNDTVDDGREILHRAGLDGYAVQLTEADEAAAKLEAQIKSLREEMEKTGQFAKQMAIDRQTVANMGVAGDIEELKREIKNPVERTFVERQGFLEFPKYSPSEIAALQKQLDEREKALAEGERIVNELHRLAPSAFPDKKAPGAAGDDDSTSKLSAYTTALEKFNATIKEVGASEEAASVKSRAAVQALLDYASASESVAAAILQIPELSSLLSAEDLTLARVELTKLAEEGVQGVLAGFAKIEADQELALAELEKTLADSRAAGLSNEAFYWDRRNEILQNAVAERADLIEELYPTGFIPTTADTLEGLPSVEDIVKDTMVDWEAMEDFRRIMRDSVKSAMRDGIRTGDWGDSFASILADAVTTGLDNALNRVGDWLAGFLFGDNGFLEGVINGASSWASTNIFGQKAVGGSLAGGRTYLVGENGPERLSIGHGQTGQLLDASTTQRGLRGGGGGGVSVNAPLIVQGSIDAVTWPKVEAAMRSQAQRIMSAVPGAVNATLIDNRIQKRRV